MMYRYGSSLRARSIEDTLRLAERIGREMGVVRVTDTTRLDRLGVPVFAAIRPGAAPLSLAVSAGKGLTSDEARVGAWMEAIELAFAEPGRSSLEVRRGNGVELRASSGYGIVDFCPRRNLEVDELRPFDCVHAVDVDTEERVLVPAESVFFPYASHYFSSDTNGLASGNTVLEATVHGLAEVFERDIASMLEGGDNRQLVDNESLPSPLAGLAHRVERLGCTLAVCVAQNAFGLPFFSVTLRELGVRQGVHEGLGCHPSAPIAATRAVCEAFQSRLTFIHGGRDDLPAFRRRHASLTEAEQFAREHRRADRRARLERIRFDDILDHSARTTTLEDTYALMRDLTRAHDLGPVLRVTYSSEDLPVQVVKVIVPRLEFFSSESTRVGARLSDALTKAKRI
jgi:ribosomal protein S12 methylthiotransferase accessory factor